MLSKVIAWAFLIATTTISLAIIMAVAGVSWGTKIVELAAR